MTRIAKIERKVEYFPVIAEIKEKDDTKYQIGGYLNYIGNIDLGDDRTMPGAFKRTLIDSYARKAAQNDDYLYPYLWNHNYNKLPPGGIYEADETKEGLYVKVQFNPEIQFARELYSSFKIGQMKKQSMGYRAMQYEYVKEDKRTIRNLLEVAVVEGSAVVFPMNELAIVDMVKSTTGKRYFVVPGTKDFNATLQERTQNDWLDDLWNLWYALKSEIINAFRTGDTPIEDVTTALDQFSAAMLAYVQQGVDIGMVEALQPPEQEGRVWGYMSNGEWHEDKAGRVLSDKNHRMLTTAADGIMSHCKSIHSLLKSAQPQEASAMGADDPPHSEKANEVDAVSTQLDELLASLTISNLHRQIEDTNGIHGNKRTN